MRPQVDSAAESRQAVAVLVLLTCVGLALRLISAGSGLWIDEIYSLVDSFRLPLREIVTTYRHDNHHPFYSALARVAILLFGESAWSVRLPSILFGTATIPMLYLLGRQVTTRREALFAAALLTVSYHHVWFSQNARGYVLLAWCTVAATWLLLRLLDERRWPIAAAYALVVGVGAYTHLTMVFIAAGQLPAAIIHVLRTSPPAERRRTAGAVMVAFGLAAVATLAFYAPSLAQLIDHFMSRPSQLVGVSTPGWALLETVRGMAAGFSAGSILLGSAVAGLGAVVVAVGLVSYARRRPTAFALFLLPGVAILGGALLARGTMYPRFFFALAGFGVLVAVRGVFVAGTWIGRHRPGDPALGERLGSAVLGFLILVSAWSLTLIYRHPKQDFLGAMAYLESHRKPGDAVAVTGVTDFAYREYLGRDWTAVSDSSALNALRHGRVVWVAWGLPRYLARTAPDVLALLEQACPEPVVFRGTVGGGDIRVCALEPMP